MNRFLLIVILAITCLAGGLFNSVLAANLSCKDTNGLTSKQIIECGACNAAGTVDSSGNVVCNPGDATGSVQNTITTVVNILSAVAGIAAVIMIIVGGLRYVTSAGNADSTKSAKNTILYAVVGLIIVALAQIIVHFVIHTASGSNAPVTNTPSSTNCPISPQTGTCVAQ